ncbi:UrcA family protein [Gluconobacter kanchanaburiensis]|uniref:UrcA family protein n=1 Tax=Gluconobacter kanchanaburiensis NBRC 103587 TaxID=1307948 RepID=A0A511B895_9PROT|nr:UrcA family protein [Gluconobacter kanchanaburiensis]MBF0862168.1 UrcA family protein [Gluconobacter kanchanaburiensis]GBR71318.1 hypothetical protein AA103587_2341 [Gluconobacter kanchanaburiensis NBRC 103587]GEK96564.1 hypothetical protein GKA01_17610 [Gluconobacter kanchanaburiensis NBRC 103587]
MIRFSAALICLLSAGALMPFQTACAAAPDNGTISIKVDLSSTDLGSAQGWSTATKKIHDASHTVCHQLQSDGWLSVNEVSDCEHDAFSNSQNRLYDLRNQQTAHHKHGTVLLARSGRE